MIRDRILDDCHMGTDVALWQEENGVYSNAAMEYALSQLGEFGEALEREWWKMYCAVNGHDIVDCSYGGPDSGNMDHKCLRCGKYWSVPLY